MSNTIDLKRTIVYLLFAFGIAWSGALVIFLTGGLVNSPSIGAGLSLAAVIVLAVYMTAPAAAHVLTRLVTRERWHALWLRPELRRGWPYWILCWTLPSLLIYVGAGVFFALFPQNYDPALTYAREMLAGLKGLSPSAVDPWIIVINQALTALLIAPVANALLTFGEEFGWRAYLQPKLMPLGARKALLGTGVIWGVWHAPLIAMGENYGLDYPGAPWLGPLVMVWFTVVLGVFLGWASLRARSVWPAVIGHGAVNGMTGIVTFFMKGEPNLLLGPGAVGLIGSIGFAVVALILFAIPGALEPHSDRPLDSPPLGVELSGSSSA